MIYTPPASDPVELDLQNASALIFSWLNLSTVQDLWIPSTVLWTPHHSPFNSDLPDTASRTLPRWEEDTHWCTNRITKYLKSACNSKNRKQKEFTVLFLEWHTLIRGPRSDVGLEPSLPVTHVYWKMIQLFLNCCISGAFPKPDQLPPTCKDTTATPLPFPGGEGKGAQSAECRGHSHAGSPCWGLWGFVKVVWLVLAYFLRTASIFNHGTFSVSLPFLCSS